MRPPNTYVCTAVAAGLLAGAAAPALAAPRPQPVPYSLPLLIQPSPRSLMPDMVHMPKTYIVTGLHITGHQMTFDGFPHSPVPLRVIPVSALAYHELTVQRR